jgi:hypothetical protein
MIDFSKIRPCQIVEIREDNPFTYLLSKWAGKDLEPNRTGIIYETRGQYLIAICRGKRVRLESLLDFDTKQFKRIIRFCDKGQSAGERENIMLSIAKDMRYGLNKELSSNVHQARVLASVSNTDVSCEYVKAVQKCQN